MLRPQVLWMIVLIWNLSSVSVPGEICNVQQVRCTNGDCIESSFLCDGITDCADGSDENQRTCKEELKLRLSDGYQGRLEIRYKGVWGTVCNTDFSIHEAKVICRMLGQSGGQTISNRPYRVKQGVHLPVWLDRVACKGWESDLVECSHMGWGHAFCGHLNDVAVQCGSAANAPECFGCSSPTPAMVNSQEPSTTSVPVKHTTIQSNNQSRNNNLIFDNSTTCRKLRRKRIVGGEIIAIEDVPWQGSVRLRSGVQGSHLCGAIVLTETTVLTAAHCVHLKPRVVLRVRVGDWDEREEEEQEQELRVDKVVVHPDYYNNGRPFNDIAILKLKSKSGHGIVFGRRVHPACLPSSNDIYESGRTCIVTGWGQTDMEAQEHTQFLRFTEIPILSEKECALKNVLRGNVAEGMFCAGFVTKFQKDACYGDSGGPLTCSFQGSIVVAGLTSWGISCGNEEKPGVYVKLTHYVDWLRQNV